MKRNEFHSEVLDSRPSCKRIRVLDETDIGFESEKTDSESSETVSGHGDKFVGGVLSSSAADSSVPRWRISTFTYISFTDQSFSSYSAFSGFDPWLKTMLNVYYEVMTITRLLIMYETRLR